MHQLSPGGFDLREPLLGQGHVSWPTFLANFRIFGILGFESRFLPDDRGIIRNTQVRLLNAGVRVLELTHGQISRHFWSTWWSDFWSTVSTAFARKPWLTVYRAHSGSSPAGGKTGQIMTKIICTIATLQSTITLNLTIGSP